MLATLGLAFLAGTLSILSPCVLPLLPIVLGAAATEHRFGPLALAGGLAVSFVAIGLFFATIGFSLGLNSGVLREASAVVLVLIGFVLVNPPLQARLAVAAGPVGQWTDSRFGGLSREGALGQLGMGLLLGAVWSPCVGPTLGAASALAAEGRNLGQVGATMLVFGIGAALPLLLLGLVSRDVLMGWRRHMLAAGKGLKTALGVVLMAGGLLVVTGFDKRLEAVLVDASPAWLTTLTTTF